MTIEFQSGWLDDARRSNWYDRFMAKEPSKKPDGSFTYMNADGSAMFANLADEIISVNAPFLEFFANEQLISDAIKAFAGRDAAPENIAHCRAALSDDPADLLTVEQGMHQPEDTGGEGFCLHVTARLTKTSREDDQAKQGKACHAYMMQNNDGSLYVTSMTL